MLESDYMYVEIIGVIVIFVALRALITQNRAERLLYLNVIGFGVSAIIALVPTIAKGIESVNSIGEVLLSEEVEHNEGKRAVTEVCGDFSFQKVHFPLMIKVQVFLRVSLHRNSQSGIS